MMKKERIAKMKMKRRMKTRMKMNLKCLKIKILMIQTQNRKTRNPREVKLIQKGNPINSQIVRIQEKNKKLIQKN